MVRGATSQSESGRARRPAAAPVTPVRTPPLASLGILADLGRHLRAGGTAAQQAELAAEAAAAFYRAPCALILEIHVGALVPVATHGWSGPVDAAWADRNQPDAGVVVSAPVATAAEVAVASAQSYPLTVRGRQWGMLAVHAPARHPAHKAERAGLEIIAHLFATALESGIAHDELEYVSVHDPLTGMGNRVLLVDQLDTAIERDRTHEPLLAVVCIDVDRFGLINENLGHRTGDLLLVELAARLRRAVRPEDTAARFTGARFIVMCEGLPDEGVLIEEAERLRRSVSGAVSLAGREVVVNASAGAAVARSGISTDELLREADLAAFQAKDHGPGRVAVYQPPVHAQRVHRFEIESDLRHALAEGGLVLYYQPVVGLADQKPVTAECLLRWEHPTRGMVMPSEFVPVAEESDLIVPLGEWTLQAACHQGRTWAQTAAGRSLGVSVNLSGRQVADRDLIRKVQAALDGSGLPPERLTLEITESVVMADVDRAVEVLSHLRDFGVRLSIDDFGTGYSSLSYLKRFPVDALKIDRSFVAGLGGDPDDAVIVGAIVRLGAALGIETVAEGVETAQQLEELIRLGCRQAQGFFFSPPNRPEVIAARYGLVD